MTKTEQNIMDDRSKKLIESGAEIVGAAIGGAIGLFGGPTGAIGGGVAGVLIAKGLTEFSNKFLSHREKAKVGASTAFTLIGLQEKLKSGASLREDDFFNIDDINRSKAEELFEGILLKCKNELEEQKIKYISNIYKNVAFDERVDSANANQILNLAQLFSYRQLTVVALVGQNINNHLNLRTTDYRREEVEFFSNEEIVFILQDFVTLDKQGLILRQDHTSVLDCSDIIPGGMKLSGIGKLFYQLLDLHAVNLADLTFVQKLK